MKKLTEDECKIFLEDEFLNYERTPHVTGLVALRIECLTEYSDKKISRRREFDHLTVKGFSPEKIKKIGDSAYRKMITLLRKEEKGTTLNYVLIKNMALKEEKNEDI